MITKTSAAVATKSVTSSPAAKRTSCPLTAADFKAHAKALPITIDGNAALVPSKEFSTGSFGWHLSEKRVVVIDGKPVTVQVSMQLVVVGSKDAGR
jgi:hypothetical protein